MSVVLSYQINKDNSIEKKYSITELFELYLMEDLGIYNLESSSTKKGLKKLYEIDNEDMKVNKESAIKWCKKNQELIKQIQELGYNENIINRKKIYEFYDELILERRNIDRMDEQMMMFSNLVKLELQNNCIKIMQFLPAKLQEIYLRNNQISVIQNTMHECLLSLSLPYNLLNHKSIANISQCFPNLISLDLSFNHISNFQSTLKSLSPLVSLKLLSLKANPISLLSHYTSSIKSTLSFLLQLDNQILNHPIEESSQSLQYNTSIDFSIHILNLENLSGVILNLDNIEKTQQQSQYFFVFSFMNQTYSTENKKILYESGTIEEMSGKTRVNFDFKQVIELEIEEIGLIEQMKMGFDIYVYCQQPKMIQKEDEEESIPLFKNTNELELETVCLGVTHVDLNTFINQTDINNLQFDIKHKYSLFDQSIVQNYNFYFPDQQETKKVQQYQQSQANLIHDQQQQQNVQLKNQPQQQQKKVDPKKVDPKKVDPKKVVKQENVKQYEPVQLLDWSKYRDFVYTRQNDQIIQSKDILLCVKIQLQ